MDFDNYHRLLEMEKDWVRQSFIEIPPDHFIRDVKFKGGSRVLEKLRNLLMAADEVEDHQWSHLEIAEKVLPKWFVNACTPELTEDEEDKWLNKWRALPRDEQAKLEDEKGWSAIDWIYWLHPMQRNWFIASSEPLMGDSQKLGLVTREWMAPIGALMWALRCAGASEIEVSNVRGTPV